MMVFVKILDQPELMKYLGLRSSEVKICYEVTSNDFGRLQWDLAVGNSEWRVDGDLVVFVRIMDWQSQTIKVPFTLKLEVDIILYFECVN